MNGIDVSQWQGTINFEAVERAGIELVYMKASEGIDFVDPFFRRNYTNARSAGLPVGFYHYLTARSVSSARQEAYHFVSVTEGLSCAGKLVMDLEDLTGLTEREINEIALAFLQAVEEFSNKEAAVYVDASNAATVIGEELAAYALWIAQYGVDAPDMDNPWEDWDGWQYTDMGRVAGIQGNVDRDIFRDGILEPEGETIQRIGERPPYQVTRITYTVRPGDTLSRIADLYYVTPSELAAWNDIADPNLIYPGERLTIEIRDDRKQGDTYILYRVKAGDTLYDIARQHGTQTAVLEQLNRIPNPNLIYVGQIIKIPNA